MFQYFFLYIFLILKITYQIEVIGFYQTFNPNIGTGEYTWNRCYPTCYTCNEDISADNTNQNCLSCNPKQGRYFLYGDSYRNCYTESELTSLYNKKYFLDKKQTPPKWVTCDESCKYCSTSISYATDGTSKIQMNCDECIDNTYIKVNSFCYEKVASDDDIGFTVNGVTKYCGEFTDDETGQQLGIYSDENQCIIKPESMYFPFNDNKKKLKSCTDNCISCEGVANDANDENRIICNKCKENFVFYENECKCPIYLGIEDNTNNCVNCKYSPQGPYNLNGECTSAKGTYLLINTTYNILSSCKRPCLTCDSTSGRCLTCAPNYYLDDIALSDASISDNTKICLTYDECNDLGYPNIYFNKCIFCGKDDNNVQQYKILNSDTCTTKSSIDGYYEKKTGYPALAKCHERCRTCNSKPKGNKFHNCINCKQEGVRYAFNSTTLNCDDIIIEVEEEEEEEEIRCENMLYYIDEEETNPNETIKCVNGSDLCPQGYDYLLQNENLCIKECSDSISKTIINRRYEQVNQTTHYTGSDKEEEIFNKIINNNCIHFSQYTEYIKNYWEFLDGKIQNKKLYFQSYLRRLNTYEYQLYGNHYIYSEDSTFHITSTNRQNSFITKFPDKNNDFSFDSKSNLLKNYYSFIKKYEYRYERRVSIIYLSECEKIIKILYGITSNLIILKLDIYRNITDDVIATNKVEYRIYDSSSGDPLDLTICKNFPINIITPTLVSKDENSKGKKLFTILKNVKKEGYEPFIVYSDFYTEICNQYKSEYDVDMNMKDRKTYIYDKLKNNYFCQKNCYYRSSDDDINYVNCICKAQNFIDDSDDNFDVEDTSFTTLEENNEEYYKNIHLSKTLDEINKNVINDYFNFYLMKCIKLLFTYDGFIYNYPSMIIIGLFILYLFLMLFYVCIGFDFYINILKEMLFHKFLYREYWRLKKQNNDFSIEEINNISFEEELKEKETRIIHKKIQNRTNTKNVFERIKKFNPNNDNKWIRMNKSSILVNPIKDDQIQAINEYGYKENKVYQNFENKIKDYKNDNNLNAPPKKVVDNKNNNYYHMTKNNDLINARTVNPITSKNYDNIHALVRGKPKKTSDDIIEEIHETASINKSNKSKEENKENADEVNKEINKENIRESKSNFNYNKKSEMHNTSPAIYIYDLILGNYPKESIIEETDDKEKSKIITKREYYFLNDGEINELDYDNSLFHDKRSFIRIYYSYLKYNSILIFTFFLCEDFNLNFVKYALFVNYLILYLTFNTCFYNNNTIHNIYINEGDYVIGYHAWKIFLAFIISIIFIKLIKWWITFYRRKSLNMKLLKRYTDTKNEILRMIEEYHFNLKIYFPISLILIIFFWYYVSCICAVFRYSLWCLLINWAICFIFHFCYSLVLNLIPATLRYISLKKDGRECLYKASRIISYFF